MAHRLSLFLLLLFLLLVANDGAFLIVRFPFENVRCLLEMPHHRRERGTALLPSSFAKSGSPQDAPNSEGCLNNRATAVVLRLCLFTGNTAHTTITRHAAARLIQERVDVRIREQ